MKKLLILSAFTVIIAFGIWLSVKPDPNKQLTIGAILPLSGPASIWGENVQKGIQLALEDKQGIQVIYEDSKGKPADGVSAFRNLKNKDVDIMLSALSAVSIPVSKVAEEEHVPLFATLTAADGIANPFTVRYYSNATNFASPAFTDNRSPLGQTRKIAVLYRNDDLGKSVEKNIQNLALSKDIKIVISEPFNPGETDFNTLLSKVRAADAEALLFVPVTPGEATGILKTAKALRFDIPLLEASNVLADIPTRASVAGIEYYTNVYSFINSTEKHVVDFKEKYKLRYNSEPNFAVAFGYDATNLIYSCRDRKEELLLCIKSNKAHVGVTGLATQIADGDFNVPMVFDPVK